MSKIQYDFAVPTDELDKMLIYILTNDHEVMSGVYMKQVVSSFVASHQTKEQLELIDELLDMHKHIFEEYDCEGWDGAFDDMLNIKMYVNMKLHNVVI